MLFVEKRFRLTDTLGDVGLSCNERGLSLAGAPLLRETAEGFAPRSPDEISALIKTAYGQDVNSAQFTGALAAVSRALNRGDLGHARMVALHLKLPDLDEGSAARVARTQELLSKYNPAEPRDECGRWTCDAGVTTSDRHSPNVANAGLELTPVVSTNFGPVAQCQAAALICHSHMPPGDQTLIQRCYRAEKRCYDHIRTAPSLGNAASAYIFPDGTAVVWERGRIGIIKGAPYTRGPRLGDVLPFKKPK